MKKIFFIAPVAASFVPAVALASAPRTFSELAVLVVDILNGAAGLLVLAGIVIYFYGLSTNILKMKDEGGEKMRAYFVWGIIVIFVMVSVWGILRLLQATLFGGDHFSPSTGSNGAPASFNVPVYTE
ncbi:MAG: hypothetical protein WC050_01040 [Candidatus Paceibacterota bacterium]